MSTGIDGASGFATPTKTAGANRPQSDERTDAMSQSSVPSVAADHRLTVVDLDTLFEVNDLLCDGFAGRAGIKLGALLDDLQGFSPYWRGRPLDYVSAINALPDILDLIQKTALCSSDGWLAQQASDLYKQVTGHEVPLL